MPSDWIQMRTTLPTSVAFSRAAAVFRGAGLSRDDAKLNALGACYSLWVLCDSHASIDGEIPEATREWVEDGLAVVSDPELAVDALLAAGWLEFPDEGGLLLPDWSKHNGKLEKKRQDGRQRAEKQRARAAVAKAEQGGAMQSARTLRAANANAAQGEERRGEDMEGEDMEGQKTPPSGGPGGDGEFSCSRVRISRDETAWTKADGLRITTSAIRGLGEAFPGVDVMPMLAGWEIWRQGQSGSKAKSVMGSIESWVRNRATAATAASVADGGDGPMVGAEEARRRAIASAERVEAERAVGTTTAAGNGVSP